MVEKVYKCTKCETILEGITESEAKTHENMPITGEDITGLVLAANGSYHIMLPSDKITKDHERTFYPDIVDAREVDRTGSIQNRVDMAIEMTRPASKIDEIMRQGQYQEIPESDFGRIAGIIWEKFEDDYLERGVVKLVRTFSENGRE